MHTITSCDVAYREFSHSPSPLPAWLSAAVCLFLSITAAQAHTLKSEDAYIHNTPSQWVLGTASMEKTISLDEGRLLATHYRHKTAGIDLLPAAASYDEFFVNLDTQRITSSTGPWKMVNTKTSKLKQGELQLDLTLQRNTLRVTKSYVVYPGSSILREWVTFSNAGRLPLTLIDPGFLDLTVRTGDPASLDFDWLTGGDNKPGSWMLKTESLNPGQQRLFDSYDPFPGTTASFPGDGINAAIFHNDQQIYPAQGWQSSPNALTRVPFSTSVYVAVGDRILFRVNSGKTIGWDTTAFDPTIAYDDGETHTASKEFRPSQGDHGWRYQYLQDGRLADLVYHANQDHWGMAQENATATPWIGRSEQHPDLNQDAIRVWTAPKPGRIQITGAICNTGNRENGMGSGGVRMGSSSYAPWTALFSRDTKAGIFIGWDYFGHWGSSYTHNLDGSVTVRLHVAGHRQTLAPGDSLTTPKAFVGLFRNDLDNAGNECLDWQYRYLWDYTREGWFPAIRALHFWNNGTGWGQPGTPWTGGNPDFASTYRKILRVTDFMSATGADVYHRDWGWWDRAGDWNGPDFRSMNTYLAKHDMGLLIYAFLYTVDPKSTVAREHPDWIVGGSTLDMSRPEVTAFMRGQLDEFVRRWGNFEWRNDSDPMCPRLGDDTVLLGQDQGLRNVIRDFLDAHPRCAFQAVNGGGICAGYDYVRYASSIQFSDGLVGPIRNYWAALMLPPDKSNDQPDISNPDNFDKATWRGTLCCNFDTSGDTWISEKLEGLRELNDIYHYLQTKGVVGQWVHVFRPHVSGDDPTVYFQRLSGDSLRGILIPKRPAPGPVTIKPKGLLPQQHYVITFQESSSSETRTGADLMENGIVIEKMPPGELIYLNLPLHPGSKLDTTAPTPPSHFVKQRGQNIGYPGIELRWRAGSDNNWVSYYEILRNGVVIDKVAKGTFYFDHSCGADLAAHYEVRTVDGAGNISSAVAARGSSAKPARIVDDTDATLSLSPQWQRQTAPAQVAHAGTITASKEKGATIELSFEGRRIIWFTKLGASCGQAAVSIDGNPPDTVDTYSADDIWGVGIYQKEFPTPARHTLRIEALGSHAPRARDSYIYLDGFRVEMQ